MKSVRRLPIAGLVFLTGLTVSSSVFGADTGQAAAEDGCEGKGVDFSKDSTLTKSERLAAMDRALNKSLNSYEDCLQSPNDGGGSQASGGSSGSGSAGSTGDGTVSSAAASGISGTEKPAEAPAAATDQETPDQDQKTAAVQPPKQAAPNGKIPDDIPPADNDTVLEKQIRQAAINETDPEKKAKLWDEYRKYKGIPKTQH